MLTRKLGDSGREITRIGLGMAAIGRPGYINIGHHADLTGRTEQKALNRYAHEMLSAAYDAGIRYFDVARSYGEGEEFLGRWLSTAKMTDPTMTVSSKWGYRYVADWRIDADVHETKDHSLDRLNVQYEESRSRLGEHIDIYQIHSATLDSGVLENDEVLERLAEIRHDGVTIGLSTSGPQQSDTIRKALSIERDGRRLFGTVQSTWNLLEQSAGPALAEASASGMGVLIKESVANGRLTVRDEESTAPLRAQFPDSNPDTVAIAAILAQPWADAVISGAGTVDQLRSNLAALDFDDGTLGDLAELAEEPEDYWNTRSRLKWT